MYENNYYIVIVDKKHKKNYKRNVHAMVGSSMMREQQPLIQRPFPLWRRPLLRKFW